MRLPAVALALAMAAFARPAPACAPAPPPGVRVDIAEESAIIVWDAKASREHFIRRASFRTTGKDFGFLVPTPDKPELAEVPDRVFDQLEAATAPEVIRQTQVGGFEPTLLCGALFLMRSAEQVPASAVAPVRVLGEQRVAGYDAVVLEADSAGALAGWLKEHGYAERPELAAWLAPYVAAKWKLTAFKIASGKEGEAVATSAVRMSFATARPFFPYREPSDQRENLPASASLRPRLLRVFFIGTERVDGAIGEAGAPWPGRAIWSDHFDVERAGGLPFSVPEGAWLTMFEDRASPRPGTDDLFFASAKIRTPVKPAPIVHVHQQKTPIPVDVVVGALVGLVLLRRRMGKPPGRR